MDVETVKTVMTLMKPSQASGSVTCFFCSTGMCVPCRGEEGKGRVRERVRQAGGQAVSIGGEIFLEAV